jgi:hypothetical protein
METIITVAQSNVTTMWGILLYWVPLLLCIFGYTIRVIVDVQKDVDARTKAEEAGPGKNQCYVPSVRIGTILGYALVSIVPVANLWAALFDVGPKIFGRFFSMLGQIFDQPLVPRRKTSQRVD